MSRQKVKFATQVGPAVLNALRDMAKDEGRQLQVLVHEALCEYMERKQSCKPRPHILTALDDSLLQYDDLYQQLAK